MIFNQPNALILNALRNEEILAQAALNRTDLITFWCSVAIVGTNGGMVGAAFGTGGESYVSGAFEMHTGATSAGGYIYQAATDGTTFSKALRAGQDWYIAWRGRAATAPTTGTQLWVGASDQPSNFLKLGVDVANHATQYCLTGPSGSTMASGVAFDTSTHTIRGYRSGTTTFLQVDANTVVTGNVDTLTDLSPYARAQNGTNANQSMETVWWMMAVPLK